MLSPRRLGRVRPTWLLALTVAIIPFASGLTGSRVFYIRDLSMFFWGQHLFLRRELLSGHFPLWDPWVGGAQSSITDALRQTFLLPAVAVRLIGSEAFGFNLWVLTPFPLPRWAHGCSFDDDFLRPHRCSARSPSQCPDRSSRRLTFRTCRGRWPACHGCSGPLIVWRQNRR